MPLQIVLFILYINLFAPVNAQQANASSNVHILNIGELRAIDDIKLAGQFLIKQELGWVNISDKNNLKSDTTFIFVHGYGSTGYEWITPIYEINNHGHDVYFYRYNWELCIDSAASLLKSTFPDAIYENSKVVVIVGHSYGGLVVTQLGTIICDNDQQIEIHSIAAPLAGYDRLNQMCGDEMAFEWSNIYSEEITGISHYQWRTQHKQDGAFRDLPVDPQKVNIPNSQVIELPGTIDGHRLGHNWSITWVIKEYLK